ncbi:MAG: hypothetical protein DMG62_06655 [Acidobacteria bacterium]|nr:MAG: hypothetical protein DMG62_06655 [Acidobacteriota bacterium]
MKPAALGIRMHSGWGILVAVNHEIEIIERRRIVITEGHGPRGNQPFHHAQELSLEKAEGFLAEYRSISERLARRELEAATAAISARGCNVVAAALLLASGRPLPALPQILASHPLIHTAEGELFREVVSDACEGLRIPVERYRECDLEELAKPALADSLTDAKQRLASAGKLIGPPWTADHKAAALAACIALRRRTALNKEIGA